MKITKNTTDIQVMIGDIMEKEGGYNWHPDDKGGPTKYGITLKTLSDWRGKKCNSRDVIALTKKTAYDIYEHNYFKQPKINLLPERIQPIIFDMAVNHGPERAIKLLQEVLLAHGKNIGTADGKIGRLTQDAAKCAMESLGDDLINTLVARRIAFYKSIVEHDQTQAVFLNGWLNRAESFRVVTV